MAANSNSVALPPADTILNLNFDTTACDLAADWYALLLKSGDTPIAATYEYVASLLPEQFDAANYTQPQLVGWWDATLDKGQHDLSVRFAEVHCRLEVCRRDIGFEGDNDIAGVGMMIAYFMGAVLGTLYFVAAVSNRLCRRLERGGGDSGGDGAFKIYLRQIAKKCHFHPFVESINAFIEASLVLTVAMMGAAIVRNVSALKPGAEPYAPYTLTGPLLMTAFQFLHALMLQSVSDGMGQHRLRFYLWSLIALLMVAVIVTFSLLMDSSSRKAEWEAKLEEPDNRDMRYWVKQCDPEGNSMSLQEPLWAFWAIIIANMVVWFIMLATKWSKKAAAAFRWLTNIQVFGSRSQFRLRNLKYGLQVLNAFLCLLTMWNYLIIFSNYRDAVVFNTGVIDSDNKWSFGQVLALATWAPVFYDFINVWLFGPERGLSSKVSSAFEVVRRMQMEALAGGSQGGYSAEAKQADYYHYGQPQYGQPPYGPAHAASPQTTVYSPYVQSPESTHMPFTSPPGSTMATPAPPANGFQPPVQNGQQQQQGGPDSHSPSSPPPQQLP